MTEAKTELVRAIGRWTLTALVLNVIIASGIFGLPKDIARLVGPAAPWACLLAATGVGFIMACFAEVASQFRVSGGPYLYARVAFGRFLGIEMGWLAWLVRLTSAAANANLFVVYLGEFWPQATNPVPRAAVLTLLFGALAAVNVRGVSAGAQVANVFTVAKLVPLVLFIVWGMVFLGGRVPMGGSAAPVGDWLAALLALIYAYGGFEAAMIPLAEAKDPRRDAPFALLTALVVVAAIYTLVHIVVIGVLADPTASDRPLAAAARVMLGTAGAALISVGAMVSTFGQLSASVVSAPRLTYAFAEARDFPAMFGVVHPRFRTPHVSIVVFAVISLGLAIYGSFIWNAILSAVARLLTYGLVCGALVVLRRRAPQADAWRLPAGNLFALAGIGFCILLILQMGMQHLVIVSVTIAVAGLNWLAVKWTEQRAAQARAE